MSMDPQNLFLSNLNLIDKIIAGLCRRHALFGDAADDFGSWVKEKLIEADYRVLRSFAGRSSMSTFLVIVITNLLRDYNVQRWGRWRTSAEARRLGTVAVQLETLMYRDGYTLAEASMVLESRGECVSQRELASIATRVPARVRRRDVGDAGLDCVASAVPDVQEAMEQAESRSAVVEQMDAALAAMDGEDQLILRLRFWEGLTVADIARSLQLEQKPLYRRLERLLLALRNRMLAAGVDDEMIADLFRERAS
jgi:RNA polymerase sigma factor (sigma-70 family)